ncbi:MAG: SH3 domain-containing protein [Desulfobacteraceae bacterium]|nr:SH3 domain-containing protein [Desulfobacteraceae bacterium]
MYTSKILVRAALTSVLIICISLGAVFSASAQQRMAVSVDVANVRIGPGTEYKELWQMERNTPILVLDSEGEWYRFEDFEGDRGYIHKDLVDKHETVITKKGLINVRTGPGTDHEVAFQAEKGVPFRVLEKKGDWIHIEHAEGEKGWIYKGLVW